MRLLAHCIPLFCLALAATAYAQLPRGWAVASNLASTISHGWSVA